MQSIRDNMLIATKLGDQGAILMGGAVFFKTKYDTYIKEKMSPKQAEQKAYDEFVKWTKLTQQSGYMEDLSAIQRHGELGKYLTLFQNTPQQYLRIELASRRNAIKQMQAAIKSNDTAEIKLAREQMRRSVRNFMVYHFLLPMTFRAAAQGFYVGDDKFIDDSGQFITAFLGSYSYIFTAGALMTNTASKIATGHAFDTEVGGVLQSFVNTYDKSVEALLDLGLMKDIEWEFKRVMDGTAPLGWQDVSNVLTTAGTILGLPFKSLATHAKGIYDFATDKTDDPRALVGYSPSVMGKYKRSPQYPVMKPYLGGGKKGLNEFLDYMKGNTDFKYFDRNKSRWIQEYTIYSEFGGDNQDVNYLYYEAKDNRDRAKFLLHLKEGALLLPPYTLADLITPKMELEDWKEYVDKLLKYNVITGEVMKELKDIEKEFYKKATKNMRESAK